MLKVVGMTLMVSGLVIAAAQTPSARMRLGDAVIWSTAGDIGMAMFAVSIILLGASMLNSRLKSRHFSIWLGATGALLVAAGQGFAWLCNHGEPAWLQVFSPRLFGVMLLFAGFLLQSRATN